MTQAMSTWSFLVIWLFVAAYVFSVVRLASLVGQLKQQGRALDAPDFFERKYGGGIKALTWLVAGRYATLGDERVTRWSGVARLLLLLATPMVVAMFAAFAWTLMS